MDKANKIEQLINKSLKEWKLKYILGDKLYEKYLRGERLIIEGKEKENV